jgi:hypothetical protein
MLKTRKGSEVWLITQPVHAELAGTMAAHWGNSEFARPGHYAHSPDPERLRREVVLAVSEHDNGWWEWEADPAIAPDGLPAGLPEVLADPVAGMQRWRKGIPRYGEDHPYASLLISDHAYWLYAAQFVEGASAEFTHALQRDRKRYPQELFGEVEQFIADLNWMQEDLSARAAKDAVWRDALVPEHRFPHARLLQTLDALSLALCSDLLPPADDRPARGLGQDFVSLGDVPRTSWEDRVSIRIEPADHGRICIEPYPFDVEPLVVSVPVRIVTTQRWWREAPLSIETFTFLRK